MISQVTTATHISSVPSPCSLRARNGTHQTLLKGWVAPDRDISPLPLLWPCPPPPGQGVSGLAGSGPRMMGYQERQCPPYGSRAEPGRDTGVASFRLASGAGQRTSPGDPSRVRDRRGLEDMLDTSLGEDWPTAMASSI